MLSRNDWEELQLHRAIKELDHKLHVLNGLRDAIKPWVKFPPPDVIVQFRRDEPQPENETDA
jgi:hypothetical protein